jgi:hypothetical protein
VQAVDAGVVIDDQGEFFAATSQAPSAEGWALTANIELLGGAGASRVDCEIVGSVTGTIIGSERSLNITAGETQQLVMSLVYASDDPQAYSIFCVAASGTQTTATRATMIGLQSQAPPSMLA